MCKDKMPGVVQNILREAFPDELVIADEELQAMEDYSRNLVGFYNAELQEFQSDREKAMDDLLRAMAQRPGGDAEQDLEANTDLEAKRLLRSICSMLGDGRCIREDMEGSEARERLMALARREPDAEIPPWALEPVEMEPACVDGAQNYVEAVKAQEEPGDMDGLYASAFYMGMLKGMSVSLALTSLPCLVALICAAVYAVGSTERQDKLGRHCREKMQDQLQGEDAALHAQLSAVENQTRQNPLHEWSNGRQGVKMESQQKQVRKVRR